MLDRQIDLSTFKKLNGSDELIIKDGNKWNNYQFSNFFFTTLSDLTDEEIERIISRGTIQEQQTLSQAFFEKNGFYKKIILYYATIIDYAGLLIPNPVVGKKLSTQYIQKSYYKGLNYLEKLHLRDLLTRLSIRALVNGSYFGVIQTLDRDNFILIDLPSEYARSRFRDVYGNDVVEFNVSYFDTISDEDDRLDALSTYPKFISSYYKKWKSGKVTGKWLKLPVETGVCFTFYDDGKPLFLSIIPSVRQYDRAVQVEEERQLEEIRKIIVQKLPHLQDGQLLFEPPEGAVIHDATCGMLRGNRNISVLTTYAEVEAISSKTSSDAVNSTVEKMLQNIYSSAGVSG